MTSIKELQTHYEKSLRLEENDGRVIITEDGAKFHDIEHMVSFPKIITQHPNLKCLKIINCNIKIIPNSFPSLFKQLHTLDLTGNNISSLPTLNNNLKVLKLSNNKIKLVSNLPSKLIELRIRNNGLMSLNLPSRNNISTLFVGNNRIRLEPSNLNLGQLTNTDIPLKNWYE